MILTNFQRVKKLGGNLIKHPDLIGPYLRTNVFSRQSPIEIRTAWWSFLAIREVDTLIRDRRIFEYGLGGSTVRWAAKSAAWTGIEDDTIWLETVKCALGSETSAHVDLQLSKYRFRREDGPFEESDYLLALNEHYDGILIDGRDDNFKDRICCFYHAENFVNCGGFIVVDDFWRYEALLNEHRAKRVQIFESVGPCRWGVTSTAIFHY